MDPVLFLNILAQENADTISPGPSFREKQKTIFLNKRFWIFKSFFCLFFKVGSSSQMCPLSGFSTWAIGMGPLFHSYIFSAISIIPVITIKVLKGILFGY